jgi:hypothetical protein
MTSTIIMAGRPATPTRGAAAEALRVMLSHVGAKLTEVEWADIFAAAGGAPVSNVRAWALIWEGGDGWSVRRLLDGAANRAVHREPVGGSPYRYWLAIGGQS